MPKFDRILDFTLVLLTTIQIAAIAANFLGLLLLEKPINNFTLIISFLWLSQLWVMYPAIYIGAVVAGSNLFKRRMVVPSVMNLFIAFLIPQIALFFPVPAIILLVIMAIAFYWFIFATGNKQEPAKSL